MISAARPLTTGAAMLVPLSRSYWLPGTVDRMSTPGAKTSTSFFPQFENPAAKLSPPLHDDAPTSIHVPGLPPPRYTGVGKFLPLLRSAPSFPAACTISTPCASAYFTASSTVDLYGEYGLPKLMLMICAPLSTA